MARKKEPELILINQERIAAQAGKLFLSRGFEATRMEEIASESEISKATLYTYFHNKKEIKNYLSRKAMKAFYEELLIVKKYCKDSLHDRYMQLCEVMVELRACFPLEFELVVSSICVDEEQLKQDEILKETYEIGEAVNQLVLFLFQDVLSEKVEGRRVIFTQWGSIYGLITLAFNKEVYIQKELHQTKEAFLKEGFEKLFHVL